MKRKLISLWLALIISMPVFAPIIAISTTGCASAPKRTYQVTSTVAITADAAMTAWGKYVTEFRPPAALEQTVKDAYDKYHAAALLVAAAGKAYAEGSGTTQGLNAAVAVVSASLSELINLVRAFGINIPSQ